MAKRSIHKNAEANLSAEQARELFNYDPKTGFLTRKIKVSYRTKIGEEVGHIDTNNGYRYVERMYITYMAHRVVWLWWFGEWPVDEIDHINGIKDDNRIENLRAVSRTENMRNVKLYKGNKSGVHDVYWKRQAGKWQARITHNGKRIHLGYFTDFLEAVEVRKVAEKKYGYHKNHGRIMP